VTAFVRRPKGGEGVGAGSPLLNPLLYTFLAAQRIATIPHLDGFDEVLRAEQSEADAAKQLGDVLAPLRWVMVDPADDRLKHDLFILHVQVVAADDLNHRLVGEHQQFVALRRDVRVMLHYVSTGWNKKRNCHQQLIKKSY